MRAIKMKRGILFSVLFAFFMIGFVNSASYDGNTTLVFSTGTSGWSCNATTATAFWQNDTNPSQIVWIYNSTYSSQNVCNDTQYADSWCCPVGFIPYVNSVKKAECKVQNSTIIDCTGIKDELFCNTANSWYASSLIESFGTNYTGICSSSGTYVTYSSGSNECTNYTYCGCVWNDTTNLCKASLTKESCCGNINELTGACETFSSTNCSWSERPNSRQDLCGQDNGKIVIYYDATGSSVNNPLCVNQILEYPCSVSVKLPFFNWFNFVLTGLGIAVVYVIMRRK